MKRHIANLTLGLALTTGIIGADALRHIGVEAAYPTGIHVSHGATVVYAYADHMNGGILRAHARCTDGSHRDGPWVTQDLQVSKASCGIYRVTYYGYHKAP